MFVLGFDPVLSVGPALIGQLAVAMWQTIQLLIDTSTYSTAQYSEKYQV